MVIRIILVKKKKNSNNDLSVNNNSFNGLDIGRRYQSLNINTRLNYNKNKLDIKFTICTFI